MSIKTAVNNDNLIVYLSGEIDHHTAKEMREISDLNIDRYSPKLLIMDFKDVSFMDSSGIGLIMGRYKLIMNLRGKLKIVNLSPYLYKMMKLAGIDRLADIEKK